MMIWERTTSFSYDNNKNEKWMFKDDDFIKEFDVQVFFSKPMDVFSLKGSSANFFKESIKKIKSSREELYFKELESLDKCPICNNAVENCEFQLKIYNADYVKCTNCNHVFIKRRPSKEKIQEFYKNDSIYQSTYADVDTIMNRVKEVAIPKVEFITKLYKERFGERCPKILDIGAGSGHFVYACRKLGFEADGIEISTYGRKFAKQNFNVNLLDGDFVKDYNRLEGYDIITFWGVIEHVTNPLEMLVAARKTLGNNKGLIVAEVPRWESISTCIQSQTPNTIIRHLDPLGHINCFSDMSIATSFVKSGLDIIGAWYFGMDAFELVNQLNYYMEDNQLISQFQKFVPKLQEQCDLSRLSDEMVLIGMN
ncbi:class I SAM-dependent methyltransferase [Anaerosalibacter sp. Marseille-P3206]|uniref:class I SAM-dependent methyltransferase n=1 Tax=Anaerosalibacter sp. Marseille-P3206 TaxID=1871005 RepID=UPI00135636CB|nr:class I SAM-dependent methyltransferase [Anaerosalibacter sp. Marseille-P3206]